MDTPDKAISVSGTLVSQLPEYRCHKIVHAARIQEVNGTVITLTPTGH